MRAILTVPLLFTLIFCKAQNSGIGVKTGVNYAYLASELANKTEPIFGLNAGIYIPILIREQLEIQPELLYSSIGGTLKLGTTNVDHRLKYLSLPLLAKRYFGGLFNVQLGPQIQWLLNAEKSYNDETLLDARSEFRSNDISIVAGAGYDSRSGLDLSLRYIHGMTTLLKDDRFIYPKNRVLQFSVGYRFQQLRSKRR